MSTPVERTIVRYYEEGKIREEIVYVDDWGTVDQFTSFTVDGVSRFAVRSDALVSIRIDQQEKA